eukprot:14412872-Alexandrium_andersonii.AAC.1
MRSTLRSRGPQLHLSVAFLRRSPFGAPALSTRCAVGRTSCGRSPYAMHTTRVLRGLSQLLVTHMLSTRWALSLTVLPRCCGNGHPGRSG